MIGVSFDARRAAVAAATLRGVADELVEIAAHLAAWRDTDGWVGPARIEHDRATATVARDLRATAVLLTDLAVDAETATWRASRLASARRHQGGARGDGR